MELHLQFSDLNCLCSFAIYFVMACFLFSILIVMVLCAVCCMLCALCVPYGVHVLHVQMKIYAQHHYIIIYTSAMHNAL